MGQKSTHNSIRSLMGALVCVPLLTACAVDLLGGDKGPPPTVYDLLIEVPNKKLGSSSAVIGIREPRALQVHDNDRIVFRPDPSQIAYFAASRWIDTLPKLIEARLVEAYIQGGRSVTIVRVTDGSTTDFQIATEIREFEISNGSSGKTAKVGIYAQIVDDESGRPISGKMFTANSGVADDKAQSAVNSLSRATSSVMSQIVKWSLRKI